MEFKPQDTLHPREFFRRLTSVIVGPGQMVRDALRRLLYIGPLRQVPKRDHVPIRSPDPSRWSNGIAAWETMQLGDDKLVSRVNRWLCESGGLNSGYLLDLKKYVELDLGGELYDYLMKELLDVESNNYIDEEISDLPVKTRLYLEEERTGLEVMPEDIGIGISQVLPIIVAAVRARESLVAVEQPELHIHPAYQVAIGDMFIVESKRNDSIFLLETHSEHLLLRLLRRIRETHEGQLPKTEDDLRLTPADVAAYFMENDGTGISVRKLDISEDGDSKGRWPEGFFEERLDEVYS